MSSAQQAEGSWAAKGVLGGAVMVVLYVLAWPPVELHFATTSPPSAGMVPVLIKSTSGTSGGRSWTTGAIAYIPKWVAVFYRPLRRLSEAKGEFNPLRLYWEWWAARW